MEVPYGFCHCGCGNKTKLQHNNGHIRLSLVGTPMKYIFGHVHVGRKRELNNNWRGGIMKDRKGYIRIYLPEHPKSNSNGHVGEHVLVCERVFGRYLPASAITHHIDENKSNNITSNFVICENEGYHQLLHKRMRAYKACGHADWGKCQYCKQYDKPENLIYRPHNSSTFHKTCDADYHHQYTITHRRKPKGGPAAST
jgi:hypothetical protein